MAEARWTCTGTQAQKGHLSTLGTQWELISTRGKELLEQQFSTPAQTRELEAQAGDEPTWYNETAAPPVKYSVPNAQKEYMMRKQAIRENAGVAGGLERSSPH